MSKRCFDSQIAEVSNGYLVKVGCQLFIAEKPVELNQLVEYYTKKAIPGNLKQFYSGPDVEDGPMPVAGEDTDAPCIDDGPANFPDFLGKRSSKGTVTTYKAANGWILVIENKWVYVYKQDCREDMEIKVIDYLFNK